MNRPGVHHRRRRVVLTLAGVAALLTAMDCQSEPATIPTGAGASAQAQAAKPAEAASGVAASLDVLLPPESALPPLPGLQVADPASPAQVALGKLLFFDPALSGDQALSCASCHQPERAWTDGLPLSRGYPSTLYFRNTPSLFNTAHQAHLYWDGRLGSDLPTTVRDHIAEAHFMNADGQLVVERLLQKPEYEGLFQQAFGGEPSYGRVLSAVAAYVASLRSPETPYDRYRAGEPSALSPEARRGLELFEGRAGCSACHSGALLSDGEFHNLGVPTNPEIFTDPLRHIVFRRFFRTLGLGEYRRLAQDPGLYALTQDEEDRGKFRTPSLREVARTGPYMHNGVFASLRELVEFYNAGGGDDPRKDGHLRALGLAAEEVSALVAFLESLSGELPAVEKPQPPAYQTRPLGGGR